MKTPKTLRDKIRLFRYINGVISVLIFFFALYLLITPYLPEVSYALAHVGKKDIPVQSEPDYTPPQVADAALANETMLFIPAIEVAKPIQESNRIEDVHENVWHRPLSSTPPSGSNTVLVAHRYATIGGNRASTFYHLPKLVVGDDAYISWGGKVYHYKVVSTETVLPSDVAIENRTSTPELTLYTCTLWTADKRIVVHASLISVTSNEEINI